MLFQYGHQAKHAAQKKMHYGLCAEALSDGKLPVSMSGIQERTTMQPAVPSEGKI